jgi:hypothetical protein
VLPRFPRRSLSWAAAATLAILGLAGGAFLYLMLVPPIRMPPRKERPRSAPLPAHENAWTEYAEALADLRREAAPLWLRQTSFSTALTADQRAYLARHAGALVHLRAGATRPRFKYFHEAPTVITPVPDLQAVRQLAEVAAAEGQRLREAGDLAGALELETAAYHYGTDLAQLDAGLLLPITAAGCRRSAAAALFASLAKEAPAEAFARAARAVAAEDGRMPSAWQATESEWRLISRTVEDGFLGARGGPAAPSAFRLRVFASFAQQHDAALEEARPLLESWDFPGLQRLDERLLPALRRRASPWRFRLIDNMAARITAGVVAPLGRPARLLYVDRANGAAFQLLAACRAYQLAHGALPTDPRAALAEAGLVWPLDPTRGRPVGYRLDDGGATAWLAGFDGQDDGGRAAYLDLVQATIAPGTDLVYRLGEPPPTLRTLASVAAHARP